MEHTLTSAKTLVSLLPLCVSFSPSTACLKVMKHMMAGGEDLGAAPPNDKTAANGATNATTNATARLPAEEVSLSLSDYVSQVAAEEGLIFLPKYLGHRFCCSNCRL